MRRVDDKTEAQIIQEWDRIARHRIRQIEEGKDLSYRFVLTPTILRMVDGEDMTKVLDVGCGPGHLTFSLAEIASKVIGIDPSVESIKIARERLSVTNVEFINSNIQEYARGKSGCATLIVANMSLMAGLHLETMISAISSLLRTNGYFIFTVTHPFFWPRYWGYEEEDWFAYDEEFIIEAPFRISSQQSGLPITSHVHRPLERYFDVLSREKLMVTELREPMPSTEIEELYPDSWEYPRFLAVKTRRH